VSWPADDWWDPQPISLSQLARLAVRVREGDGPPVILVHGLASNALLWRDVAEGLVKRGNAVAAVDLRGHGRSDRPERGYDTAQCAADVCEVVSRLGWIDRRPLLAGQSWGGNVVVRAAATTPSWGGLLCIDGGWIHLRDRFETFDECWRVLAPPAFGDTSPDDVLKMLQEHLSGWPPHALGAVAGNLEVIDGRVRNRLSPERHRSILHSLWSDSPALDYAKVACPTHLMVAGRETSPEVERAVSHFADATVSWHPDAHHDIHLQYPERVLDRLDVLLSRVEGSSST
jgi:pimeloyl-ACP methyl ester carboxylesterase